MAAVCETFVPDANGTGTMERLDRMVAALSRADRKRLLQSVQPGARFTVVPGAGHWVQYEAPDQFNRVITEYAAD